MNGIDLLSLLGYVGIIVLVWIPYGIRRKRRSEANRTALAESQRTGMGEPPSLHPLIDASLCLGCGSCVPACPEGDVLGLIGGKAVLVRAANCIGHGACKDVCPQDAITLVLGTEKRGVDIPMVSPDFETNVPGLFVAGELGGMGLIRNAIEQGRQAIDSVRAVDGIGSGDGLDVLIVGAGPAGFSASLAAKQHGLRFETLEQETLGGTVAHYPRGKIVMTAPVLLPLYGKSNLRETTKEALLGLWEDVVRKTGLGFRFEEGVEGITPTDEGFEVESSRGKYRTRTVLLAIGRRGTPRKLGVPGEELPKVVYRLIDPEQYRGQNVLVVGGGDSALEAATSMAAEPGTQVTISYRSEGFSRAKPKNRDRVDEAVAAGTLRVMLESKVEEITASEVRIETGGRSESIANDIIIVCAGGVLPTGFLKSIGVTIETKHGKA
jgi:thioredoxin reductase/ferredoxin